MIDPNALSPEDRELYNEIRDKFYNFKLKKFKIRVLQEAKLVHTDAIAAKNQVHSIADIKKAMEHFVTMMKAGKWATGMLETEYTIYVDPEEKDLTPEEILKYQLLVGDGQPGSMKDYRILSSELVGEVFAHNLLSPEKLQESIEGAFTERKNKPKEPIITKTDPPPPDRMN